MMAWAGYVICDLDGCLSDDRARHHLLPNYKAYHAAASGDPVVKSVRSDVLYDLCDENGIQQSLLLIVTGRPEKFRSLTRQWLGVNLPGIEYWLLMRPDNDYSTAPLLKVQLIQEFLSKMHSDILHGWERVVSAYDDRADILDRYPIPRDSQHVASSLPAARTVPEILRAMATTFEERNAEYGDNYCLVAPVMKALWPDGVPSALVTDDRWHLFELIVVKLTRFAATGLTHSDSIHDLAVYGAMIEANIERRLT